MYRSTPFLAPLLFCAGCLQTDYYFNEDHCDAQDGNNWCAEKHGDELPFCRAARLSCNPNPDERPEDGCVAQLPEDACFSPCGDQQTVLEGASCDDPSASSSTSGGESTQTQGSGSGSSSSGTTTTTTTDDPTTTGPAGCQGPDDCSNPNNPFCIEGLCSPCSAAIDENSACAKLDPNTPVCLDDQCVQCSLQNATACLGDTPICDPNANACVPCSFHEQCQDAGFPACNLSTGACFSNDAVSLVDAGPGGIQTIQAAIDQVPNNTQHAIVLSNGGGIHNITIDNGKAIAIVSDSNVPRIIEGSPDAPTLSISGSNSFAFLHNVRFDDADTWAIDVSNGATLYADNTQVFDSDVGGIRLDGASAFIRNSMVGAVADTNAVDSTSSVLELLYVTSVAAGNLEPENSLALRCTRGAVTVRNSILASRSDTAVDCPGADITDTFEAAGDQFDNTWFNFMGNELLLLQPGPPFEDQAVWRTGDPPFDINGNPRPTVDRDADYPGADIPEQ